jgi:hypothetical protein
MAGRGSHDTHRLHLARHGAGFRDSHVERFRQCCRARYAGPRRRRRQSVAATRARIIGLTRTWPHVPLGICACYASALSDQVESPDRKEFAPIQKLGACPCRKSGSTFPGHALIAHDQRPIDLVARPRGIGRRNAEVPHRRIEQIGVVQRRTTPAGHDVGQGIITG